MDLVIFNDSLDFAALTIPAPYRYLSTALQEDSPQKVTLDW